ncbi:MAG: TerB family tellurite resistance protein [Kiritimatiellae bacterium]|nr:TerB family tellurite resistance protein [Kiritimatiellia bacterium]
MGWKGALWGAFIGGRIGGALGAIIAAAIGSAIESAIAKQAGEGAGRKTSSAGARRQRRTAGSDGELAFAAAAAAMFAKLAKADGRITQSEIDTIESAFSRLGFSPTTRAFAINVFRRAKDDTHTIYQYAYDFASIAQDAQLRELIYELLWELAAADGNVSREEHIILRTIAGALGVHQSLYAFYARRYTAGGDRRSQSSGAGPRTTPKTSSLDAAFSSLGITPDSSFEDARKAYREKAKQYHPDRLRAQGLPEGLVEKATQRMAELNSAWDEIRKAKGWQ